MIMDDIFKHQTVLADVSKALTLNDRWLACHWRG
jgi:hypothetical protein